MTRGALLCKILLAFEMSILVVVMKLCIKEVVTKRPLTRAYEGENLKSGVGFCLVSMPRSNIKRAVALLGDVILQIRY